MTDLLPDSVQLAPFFVLLHSEGRVYAQITDEDRSSYDIGLEPRAVEQLVQWGCPRTLASDGCASAREYHSVQVILKGARVIPLIPPPTPVDLFAGMDDAVGGYAHL